MICFLPAEENNNKETSPAHGKRQLLWLQQKNLHKQWCKQLLQEYGLKPGEINYVFGSDEWLLEVNRQFLDHDYFTDIITFDQRQDKLNSRLDADILISIERVRENALVQKVSFLEEMRRVMAHGLLHLAGLKDKTPSEQKQMRMAEDKALALFSSMAGTQN